MYVCGKVAIEDRMIPVKVDQRLRLERTLSFDAPQDCTLWFRPLTGAIERESIGVFQTPALRLIIPAVPTVLRPTAADATESELLLKIELPKGKSKRTLTYDLRP